MLYKLFFVFVCLSFRDLVAQHVSGNYEWDILVFTQQWPMTVCREMMNHHHTKKCSMPAKRDSWSIHGIWPDKLGTKGPNFCNRTWLFDPEQIRPIENDLMKFWKSIDADSQPYQLWSHEWSKHGTCAASLQAFNSELKYFSKGLQWLEKYSMTDILAEGNILPSNTDKYKVLDIHNAVKAQIGVNPMIQCLKEDGDLMIDEIRICFDKSLSLRDCDGDGKLKVIGNQTVITNCNPNEGILYPHYSQGSFYIQLYKLISFLQWLTL